MGKNDLQPPTSVRDVEFDTRTKMDDLLKKVLKIATLAVGCALGMIVCFWLIIPLKRAVPYEVHVNDKTGEVTVPANQSAQEFKPEWKNEYFYLNRWINDLFEINQYTTVNITNPRAQALLRGQNALTEFNTFRHDDQTLERLVADPSLTRSVTVSTLTQVAGTTNVAVANVHLETHQGGQTKVEDKLITINFVILPQTDIKDAAVNSIGIFITDFKISAPR